MALDQSDRELIKRIVYRNGDNIAVSIARSFERIEERIVATESRLITRFDEMEEKLVSEPD